VIHRPYPKIRERHDAQAAPDGVWVATEKLHGAQLVVATDGKHVRIGKRKAWLEVADPFFGWQLLHAELDYLARAVHEALDRPDVVRLYGELVGGGYPHLTIAPVPGVSPVQTGIWYAPGLHYAVFDVLVEADGVAWFLADSELRAKLKPLGALVVPLVARGSRVAVGDVPVRFETRLPRLLELPPIAGNLAEGLVLRPDARASLADHYATKRKIEEFAESRFDESRPWEPPPRMVEHEWESVAASMVNLPRLASARSKIGMRMTDVLAEMVLDVLVDLELAFPRAFAVMTTAQQDSLRSRVADLAQRLVADQDG